MTTLAGKSPWRKVEHDGDQFLVRENVGATWIVRLDPDREVYVFEGDAAPAWARANAQPVQGALL